MDSILRAAEDGCPQAQSALGCYFATVGEPDLVQSRFWYLQAAINGNPNAMYEIGFTLLLGEGGPSDPRGALRWLEKAAAYENALYVGDARGLLVDVYTEGLYGVSKDPLKAARWKGTEEKNGGGERG